MNKLALVTGGSRGIGAATVALLRERGWDVLVPGRGELDFTRRDSVDDYGLNYGLERNALDALVFCHGSWYSHPLHEQYSSHYYDQFIERVAMPQSLMHWLLHYIHNAAGSVTMVSSTRGFIGGVNTGPYSAACAAQIALMQGYAREYAGVRFNCVAPGWTDTDMGKQVAATGGVRPGAVPQPPSAVANVIVGLVEDEQSNGRIVRVVDSLAEDWAWGRK